MGKRMGLARFEALLENQKRELAFGQGTKLVQIAGTDGSGAQQSFSSAAGTGYGIHEYYEVVTPATADDNDVAASLSVYLPAQAIITEAALIPVELATSDHGLLALEVHSAAIADDAASAGTEIVGEDVSGNVSVPDNDCDLDATAGVLGKGITMGTLAYVERGTDVTYLHVTAKEDLSSMTGSPKVGVYIKWLGQAPVVI